MTQTAERTLSYRDAINEALRQEMDANPDIILLGEDIAGAAGRRDQGFVDAWGGPFRTTQGLVQQFGEEPGPRHPHLRGGLHRGGNRLGGGGHAHRGGAHVHGLRGRLL